VPLGSSKIKYFYDLLLLGPGFFPPVLLSHFDAGPAVSFEFGVSQDILRSVADIRPHYARLAFGKDN